MYDVIVIGAGSAGAALAARLTEDEDRSVLLLEAGPDYRSADTLAEIQSIEPLKILFNEEHASTYTHTFQASRSAAQEAQPYPRGRGVGGSSAVNGLFAIRATVEDFDGWAAAGCTGWGFDEVLPLLTKLESDQDFPSESFHGSAGPIPVTRPRREDFNPVEAAIDEFAERLGHPWAPDHNAPGSTGTSPYAYNGFGPVRVSTNDGYLEPARGRAGLRIIGDALVDRVLLSGNRAIGVSAIVGGQVTEFRAAEVVVSAGALHTPGILQRSGIGPAEDLRRLGVEPVADLPVGRGLQDHPGMALILLHDDPPSPGSQRGKICVRFTTGIGDEVNDAMIASVGALGIGVPIRGLVGWGNRVTSTGVVQLLSTNPLASPQVDLNLLSDSADLARMRVIVDELRAFAAQPELQKVALGMGLGGAMTAPDLTMSDSDFAEFALANVIDTAHACGTCRMGNPSDPSAVVDPEGRVLGIDGLRVADASVFPWVTRANTNLTAILVGEKIAEFMRKTTS